MLGEFERARFHHAEDRVLADAFGEPAGHRGDGGVTKNEGDRAFLRDALDAGLRQVFLLKQTLRDHAQGEGGAAGGAGERLLEFLLGEIEQVVAFLDFRDDHGIVDAAEGFERGGDGVAQAEAGVQLAVIGGRALFQRVAS